jgi:leucyl aminopeptidase
MKVSVSTISLGELDVDMLVVPITEEDAEGGLVVLADQFGGAIERVRPDVTGRRNTSTVVYPDQGSTPRVVMVGLGGEDEIDAEAFRRAAALGAGIVGKYSCETVALAVPNIGPDLETTSQSVVEGFLLGSYSFLRYRTDDDRPPDVQRIVLQTDRDDKATRRGAERGRIVAESVCTARDLVNLSPDEKTPTLFAKAIEKSARKHGYDVSIWDKAIIEEEGMNGLLAVNRGSVEPPTFSILEWSPENARNKRPVVLVGKGVVFDTGGLSLKPTKDSMDSMKSDMAGAAAVIGAMEAVARLELPLHVVGLIPATDNRPGEKAYVPGDVVRMHSGTTVEVLNTDAEGRMILADALSYARTYSPEVVIDVATLTGAVVIALGEFVAGVMTNETSGAAERLERISAAGRRSGDLVHPLPMYEEYAEALKSDVADLKNVGGRPASSITAAKFLERFVDYPWIHIDIAGPAFLSKAQPYRPVGGTGFGVRLLIEYLREASQQSRS